MKKTSKLCITTTDINKELLSATLVLMDFQGQTEADLTQDPDFLQITEEEMPEEANWKEQTLICLLKKPLRQL